MLERDVEKKLVEGVRALGGTAYKFISPGRAGVPDRIVVLPGGRVEFVELKTWRGQLTALQECQIARLEMLGCDVRVLFGTDDVETFLEDCAAHVSEVREEIEIEVRTACVPTALH